MPLKLYYNQNNYRGLRNVIAATLGNVELESVLLNSSEWKTDAHLKRHPLGKVPVLEHETGYLFESNAILRHIARLNPASGLYGNSVVDAAYVDQWLDFLATEVECNLGCYQYAAMGYHTIDEALAKKSLDDLNNRLKVYDNHFKSNNFLVGTALTIADVATVCSLKQAFQFVVGEQVRKTLPNLVRYFEFVVTQPVFATTLGRTRYCTVAFPLPAPQTHQAQAQPQQKQAKPQAEKKEQPKKEQPKKEQPKKEEKVEDEEEQPKKKEANPLDLLPPSTFNLDDWKRRFLAAKDSAAQKAEFEWFWQNFDEQGWSLWEITYEKEANEGTMLIKSNNTMNGFLQRTDPHFKKFAFAIHGVYGEEPNLQIQGAWLWRGTDIPFELRDHPSYEVHRFVKLEKGNEEQRKLFEEYWLNQTEDESLVKGLRARTLVYYR